MYGLDYLINVCNSLINCIGNLVHKCGSLIKAYKIEIKLFYLSVHRSVPNKNAHLTHYDTFWLGVGDSKNTWFLELVCFFYFYFQIEIFAM